MQLSPIVAGALHWLGTVCLLAAFALAACAKLRDQQRARDGLIAFGVPEKLARHAFVGLVAAELLIAALLALPSTRPFGAIGALGALGVFTLAICWQLVRGRRPTCACFGALTPAAIGWGSVGRNLALMATAGAVLALPATPAPNPIAPLAIVWVGVSAAWLLLLTRQNGRLLLRIEHLEQIAAGNASAPAPAGPLRVGDEVPPLGLSDAHGRPFDLRALRGRPLLLLFLDVACAHCQPLLARLREAPPTEAAVVVISESAALRDTLPAAVGVVLDPGWSTMARFGLRGTPAAATVGADGTLERTAVHGASAVLEALDQFSPQEARHALASV